MIDALEDRILSIMDSIVYAKDRLFYARTVYFTEIECFTRIFYFQGPFTFQDRIVSVFRDHIYMLKATVYFT